MKVTENTMELIPVENFVDYDHLNSVMPEILKDRIRQFQSLHDAVLMKKHDIHQGYEYNLLSSYTLKQLEEMIVTCSRKIVSLLNETNQKDNIMFFQIPEMSDSGTLEFVDKFVWNLSIYNF